MRHERGGDATVTRGGRTGVCLADEVNGHTIRIHRPVPAIVESGVQHLDGCVVIGSIVHDDDAFRADRLGHPPAARAASRQWEVARYPRLTLMHVCGRGLGADFGGEVVGLNLPHRAAADLRISEFHIRHMRLLRHQRLQAVAAFIQILDQ